MKLALGTAQFGLDYGVANASGQLDAHAVAEVLAFARQAGIDTLDTAAAYGQSEPSIGHAGADGFSIVTKLPPAPPDLGDAASWVRSELEASLARLNVGRVYGYLLHRPELLDVYGPAIAGALREAKEDGLVSRVGVSIYDPEQLDRAMRHLELNLVQAPFNPVDRRIVESGWAARLKENGTELHTRSSFLQGLLLMAPAMRPDYFQSWAPLFESWQGWLEQEGISPTAACLEFAGAVQEIDRIVVGVDSLSQLQTLVREASGQGGADRRWPDIQSDDPNLINPARWALN